MSEREVNESKRTETREQSADQRQPKQAVSKRRPMDTLTDENPLICRGMD